MKKFIPCAYAEYGRYIDEFRGIPFHRDALKPVERRLLLTLHGVARKKTVKCARIVGECIGKYHPHGDLSTYDALVKMVNRGYAVGQGNFGKQGLKDGQPAAYRYTEAKANPDLDGMAFELIKFVNWFDPENLGEDQPWYLPAPIPLGLIGHGIIQGITFNTTKVPRYVLGDLIKRLISLMRNEADPTQPLETIIPQIPNCQVCEDQPGDFEKILTVGEGTVKVFPNMTVTDKGVHVWGKIPTGVSSWEKYATDERNPKPYNIIDLSNKNGFQILFEPMDGVIDQQFIDIIYNITWAKIHFKCNFVEDNGTVSQMSIDKLLINSYYNWVDLLKQSYQSKLTALQEKLFDLEVIAVVREIINKYNLSIKRVDDIVQTFTKEFAKQHPKVSEDSIRYVCGKHSIKRLVEVSIDTNSVHIEIKDVQKTIDDIGNVAFKKISGYIS